MDEFHTGHLFSLTNIISHFCCYSNVRVGRQWVKFYK